MESDVLLFEPDQHGPILGTEIQKRRLHFPDHIHKHKKASRQDIDTATQIAVSKEKRDNTEVVINYYIKEDLFRKGLVHL